MTSQTPPLNPALTPAQLHKLERNITLFYAFRFLREAQIWIPVWIVFLIIDRGFSLTQLGIAEAAFLIGLTLLEVPTGAIADHYGRSFSLTLGCLVLIGAILVFAFTTSFPILMASFLLWSVAETLLSGADLALLYDSLKALKREEEYEKIAGRGEGLLWAGAAVGVLIGAPVAQAVSTQFTIFVGAATLSLAVAVSWAMTEAPHRDDGSPPHSYWGGAKQAFRIAWGLPTVRTGLIFMAALAAGVGAVGFLEQPFLLDKGREVNFTFSLLQLPGLIAGVIGATFAFRVVRRLGPVAVLIALPLAGIGSYAALALIDELAAIGFFAVLMLFRAAIVPIATGYLNRRVPSGQRATILSMFSLVVGLLLAPFSVSVGVIFDELGLQWAFAIPGIGLAILALITGSWWVRTHRREHPHPSSELVLEIEPPSVVAPGIPPHPGNPA